MIKIHMLRLILVALFSVSSFAVHAQNEKVFSFEKDSIINVEKLEKARQFCLNNRRNIFMTVDDNAVHRMILKTTVIEPDHAVFEFKNGDDLLEALRNKNLASVLVPNARVVVLDNQMPGTFGVEVMAIIKQEGLLKWDEGKREVPVVLNTDTPVKIDEILQNYFAKIPLRKNSKDDIKKVVEEKNSPFGVRTRNQT